VLEGISSSFKKYFAFFQKDKIEEQIRIQKSKGVKTFLQNYLFKKIQIYQDSLTNLIEGQREVMLDQKFQLPDGLTVKQKMQIFEDYLKQKLHMTKNKFKK